MSLARLTDELRRRAAENPPLGHKIKFDLGEEGIIHWDGTGEAAAVSNADADADTVIRLSAEDFEQLMKGTLDPTVAFMLGKLKIEGKMGVAMKLSTLLGG
jgi:putative sterol carrier protein